MGGELNKLEDCPDQGPPDEEEAEEEEDCEPPLTDWDCQTQMCDEGEEQYICHRMLAGPANGCAEPELQKWEDCPDQGTPDEEVAALATASETLNGNTNPEGVIGDTTESYGALGAEYDADTVTAEEEEQSIDTRDNL